MLIIDVNFTVTPGTLTVTPGKSSKIETPVVSANGCPPADVTDTIKPMDVPATHFPTYSTNFAASNNTSYPPAFPPANVSVPPPPVNTMNHIVPTMHHIGSSAAIRPTPPSVPTTNQPTFQPYSYPTNASYFSANNPIPPPAAPPRNYYPPQP